MPKEELARGHLSLKERLELSTNSLQECLKVMLHVQEYVFDSLPLKQELFEQVDQLMAEENTLASICSSTLVHLPSLIFERVKKHKDQCLVAHPINPPLNVRLVELIPCAETREEILIRTRLRMDEIGQKPVLLRKEISGFALNRLQSSRRPSD